jgi:hypothetical protein
MKANASWSWPNWIAGAIALVLATLLLAPILLPPELNPLAFLIRPESSVGVFAAIPLFFLGLMQAIRLMRLSVVETKSQAAIVSSISLLAGFGILVLLFALRLVFGAK